MELKPVDFKAVAAKGAYVYCYLREDGTPYYVGMSADPRGLRPFSRHSSTAKPPRKNPERVRPLRTGLTRQEAEDWEKFYINRYGRKDLQTGILGNRTDGGDGGSGVVYSQERKEKLSAKLKEVLAATPPAVKEARRQRRLGRECTEATRAKIGASHKGRCVSETTRAKIRAANTGKKQSRSTIEKRAISLRGVRGPQPKVKEAALARGKEVREQKADQYEIPSAIYMSLSQLGRNKLKLWLRYNPEYSFADRQRALEVFGQSPKLSQQMRNADKTGHSWEEWKALSHKRRNTALKRASAA